MAVRFGAGLAVLSISACYTYVPVEIGVVPEGEDVRVYLTREGMEGLPELATEDEPVISGTLLRREGSDLLLRVPIASRRAAFHTAQIGQNVRVPVGGVVQLERRMLDPFGTGLLVAGTAGAAATVIFLIMDDAGGEITSPPPGPAEIRVPLFSFPIR